MSAPERGLTLITGDRVEVSAGFDQVRTFPGPGRSGVRFSINRAGGHLYVIPSDAFTLLGSHRLDQRLFDVTELVADRYDDPSRSDLPLIVTYKGAPAAAATALRDSGATAQRELPGKERAAHVPKAELPELFAGLTTAGGSTSPIAKVWLDGRIRASLDRSVPQIGAPAAWQAGLTGKGVKVAVLDSGIDAGHPDLSDAVLEAKDFTGSASGTQDLFGHGTHVASIVTGSGAASGGKYKGVAPDAGLLVGKVLDDTGSGSESQAIAGMQWAAAEGARVVNMSFGHPDTPGVDPQEDAVNTLTAQTGTLFVGAAGNQPFCENGVFSPASADAALSVGAVDPQDQMADFSCHGPRIRDDAIKPDITAPGVGIVAARAAGAQIGEPVDDAYLRLSGTSQASPHVAGAAAILAQQHPDWRAEQLKAALTESAEPASGVSEFEQGAGRVDVAKAITQTVTAGPSSLSFGLASWPHQDDAPVTRTVTYGNSGTDDVTLALAATLTGPDGSPAAASSLTVSPSTVTVPAGGTAAVSVTSDTRTAGPDGVYAGRILATGGGQSLTTLVSVSREVESYDLTIPHVDRKGQPTGDYLDAITSRDQVNPFGGFGVLFLNEEDGVTNLRLPKGHYLLQSTIDTGVSGESSLLVQPRLDLTRDLTSTMDARSAKPITISVPEATARNVLTDVGYQLTAPTILWASDLTSPSPSGLDRLSSAQVGPGVPEVSSMVSSQWARPDPADDGLFENTPYIYALSWQRSDGFFTGFSKSVRQSELATVQPTIAAHQAGTIGVWNINAQSATMIQAAGFGYGYTELPAAPTVYATTAQVKWSGEVVLFNEEAGGVAFFDGTPVSYRAGQTYHEHWAQAVMGPAFPAPAFNQPWASRTGDVLALTPPEADSEGHHSLGLTGAGSLTVYRDGVKLGSLPYSSDVGPIEDEMTVAAGPGDYRLDLESTGSGVLDVSTAVQTSWTFTSTTPPGTGTTVLPLWAIRFQPAVDDHNVLRAGGTHTLPIVAEAQKDSAVGSLTGLTVQTSTDDGRTWQDAPVRATGGNAFAVQVAVPDGATFVSVRAQATDSLGNTVKESISRAYKVSS